MTQNATEARREVSARSWVLVLPGEIAEVARAREFARRAPALDDDEAETVALLVSELVTNSIEHSRSGSPGGRVVVVALALAPGLRVEVHDEGGEGLPALSAADDLATSGRGLQLVDALSRSWGFSASETGTTTWFAL
ncbi:ATP-binding protein [Bailinhaonella thermotolerans]|uniref:ATP-binding protein n=1 Tax=Bailinhaonella thermotolerans TaxID=1070861 RepID=A0A3A4AN68_9ACTN|nr:ATP-binding protein [Bailinhaonella thermotolerans]RJL30441.1 ATP-binding protein [Bailinhaonella thermotolerans]